MWCIKKCRIMYFFANFLLAKTELVSLSKSTIHLPTKLVIFISAVIMLTKKKLFEKKFRALATNIELVVLPRRFPGHTLRNEKDSDVYLHVWNRNRKIIYIWYGTCRCRSLR